MIAEIDWHGRKHRIDLQAPLDLSLTLRETEDNPRAWYVDLPRMEAVMTEQFTGSTALGGAVNFRDIYFNPHGHGTHTECVGHIANPILHINDYLDRFWFGAHVMTIDPSIAKKDARYMKAGDHQIRPDHFSKVDNQDKAEAVIIRTTPNTADKRSRVYSGTNPPYMVPETMSRILELGYEHVLIDLPSVDREEDEGLLESHHVFWNYPEEPAYHRTISELIYVPDSVKDGFYFLNLQVAPFRNDAAPSRPVLYRPI